MLQQVWGFKVRVDLGPRFDWLLEFDLVGEVFDLQKMSEVWRFVRSLQMVLEKWLRGFGFRFRVHGA